MKLAVRRTSPFTAIRRGQADRLSFRRPLLLMAMAALSLALLFGGRTPAGRDAAVAADPAQVKSDQQQSDKPKNKAKNDTQKRPDSVDRDYREELPRLAAKSPEDALKTFQLAPGFEIQQVAAEPLIVDPVAMAFDAHGRLFVIEMRDYSEQDRERLGRVRMLEDSDRDGRFDQSTIYADDLSWPTAVTCYDGGIFVGSPPDLMYFKDSNGDGRADVRKTVFTGFGRGNVQGLMNTLKWGLDNRIHGATSSSGALVKRVGAKPGKPLVLRGRDFAIEPRSLTMQPTSGGGQHGLSFNQWGEKFVCSNSNHIQLVLYDDHYAARNPFITPPAVRRSIATDGPQADVFRNSPVEPWRTVRTRLRRKGIVPGPVERGGKAAGYFTGATGVTIYRGSAWPDEYYGWALVGDVGSNLVHRKRLSRNGVSYLAKRVDEKTEFLTSSDTWFRPVQFANGPDGALYVADMYREVIEHPLSLPPVIKKHLDLTSGRDRGRIYRIAPAGFKAPAEKLLGDCTVVELAAALEHRNGWRRETAARLLYERQDASATPALERLASGGKIPEGRIRALYALSGLSQLKPPVVLTAMNDKHPQVRRHALRVAEQLVGQSSQIRDKICRMVGDEDQRVRYQAAFSLGAFLTPQRNRALADLIRSDGQNDYLRYAARSSMDQGTGAVLALLISHEDFRKSALGKQLIPELTAQIGRQRRSDDVAALLQQLPKLSNDSATLQLVVKGLRLKAGDELAKQVSLATGGKSGQVVEQLVSASRRTAVDPKKPLNDRVRAVQTLRLGDFAESRQVFAETLAPAQPTDVQLSALSSLASFDHPGVAELVLENWPSFSPQIRVRAGDILFSRLQWASALLKAVETKRVPQGDLEPGRLRLLAASTSADLSARAKKLLKKSPTSSDRVQVVANYRSSLGKAGDIEAGRKVFRKVCAACHRLEGAGHPIGPNLAAMKNRGAEAILLNVLAPNREVNPQYLNYIVQTTDGRSLTGVIAAETATSITLRRAENQTDTVLRIDIEALRSTGQSLMPVGLEKQIPPADMSNLITYLRQLE